jgi:hypothetical protein
MNKRYKLTRLNDLNEPTITLEESIELFQTQPDFMYAEEFSATQDGVQMKIKGHFFMWQVEGIQIPFRFFDGEIYVAVSHPAILERAEHLAMLLQASLIEG